MLEFLSKRVTDLAFKLELKTKARVDSIFILSTGLSLRRSLSFPLHFEYPNTYPFLRAPYLNLSMALEICYQLKPNKRNNM